MDLYRNNISPSDLAEAYITKQLPNYRQLLGLPPKHTKAEDLVDFEYYAEVRVLEARVVIKRS